MKISNTDIYKRIKYVENNNYNIVNYDFDNAYPQNIIDIINNSGITKSCVELYNKFIIGDGFENPELNKIIVNNKNQTLLQIFRFASKDYSRFNGFPLHFNYNANFGIEEINPIPFEYCRLTLSDDMDNTTIKVYNDWTRIKKRNIYADKIDIINKFNPDKNVVKAEIEAAGGFGNYKGQILWLSNEGHGVYPLAPFDSILEDCTTDSQIKTFRLRNVTTGFLSSYMFVYKGEFESDYERQDFVKTLEKFQGADNTGKMMLVEAKEENQIPDIKKFEQLDNDKIFEWHEESTRKAIIQSFGQPLILLGFIESGKLGMSAEIIDATKFYNSYTQDERNMMSGIFSDIMKYFKTPIISDFKIKDKTIWQT